MSRNKYSKEFEEEMIKFAKTKTFKELLQVAKRKYEYKVNENMLRKYLSKRKIRYKDYSVRHFKVANVNSEKNGLPLGTEVVRSDGMVLVKVAKNKWQYKQRYIYEQYYNVKLSSDDYIIFLDQERTNFDISNLKKISRRESSILSNQKMFSKNKDVTETGILVAKLMIKTKERSKNAI